MASQLADMQYFGPGIILRPSGIHRLEPRLVFPYNEILTKLLNSQEQPRTTSEASPRAQGHPANRNSKGAFPGSPRESTEIEKAVAEDQARLRSFLQGRRGPRLCHPGLLRPSAGAG